MFDAIWCISNVIAHDTRSVDNRATDIVPLWSISDVPLLWCLIGVLWDWDILSLQILFTSLSLCIVPTLSILYLQQGTSGTIIITVISLILLQELLWKLYTNRTFYDLVLYWYRHTYITHHRGNDSENTGEILRAHEGCTYLYVDRGTYPTARGHSPKARSARSHIIAFFWTHPANCLWAIIMWWFYGLCRAWDGTGMPRGPCFHVLL